MGLSKDQKETLAKETFVNFPNAKVVFVIPDGQCFLAKNRACMNAPESDVVEFNRIDVMPIESDSTKTPENVVMKANEKIALIASATAEDLEELSKDESRKTVVEAITARKTVLESEAKNLENK